ncbi:hypothetical protein GBAR_LOCUS20251, partial [Geodia barretti]
TENERGGRSRCVGYLYSSSERFDCIGGWSVLNLLYEQIRKGNEVCRVLVL